MRLQIDWPLKLQYLLQTLAFCLALSAIMIAFQPDRVYDINLRYSLAIGVLTWALVDFGRHLFPSSVEYGWPKGLAATLLPLFGIVVGYLGGTALGDWWCGFSSWGPEGREQLRISIVITLIAGIAANLFFYSRGKTVWLQARMGEANRQATEAQLMLLQAQLEPHMLFNTLANLRALISVDPARAQTMLDHLDGFLRATLSASRATDKTHALHSEFARLGDYLALMAVRMGPRLQFTLDLPADLRNCTVPPLLLQPLVENSLHHGLEPKVEGGSITVSARRAGASLVLEVSDTGLGLNAATTSGSGFGLTQVRQRLAVLYQEQAQLQLAERPQGGTQATITLPISA